jgi:hypothetical protein
MRVKKNYDGLNQPRHRDIQPRLKEAMSSLQRLTCIGYNYTQDPSASSIVSSTVAARAVPLALCSGVSSASSPATGLERELDCPASTGKPPLVESGTDVGFSCPVRVAVACPGPENNWEVLQLGNTGESDVAGAADVEDAGMLVVSGVGKTVELDWSSDVAGGVWVAFASDESDDDGERCSGSVLGIGLRVMGGIGGIELVLHCVVVGVGIGLVFSGGAVPDGLAPGPSILCNGSKDQPSGITTPGGRSAPPAGMGKASA